MPDWICTVCGYLASASNKQDVRCPHGSDAEHKNAGDGFKLEIATPDQLLSMARKVLARGREK